MAQTIKIPVVRSEFINDEFAHRTLDSDVPSPRELTLVNDHASRGGRGIDLEQGRARCTEAALGGCTSKAIGGDLPLQSETDDSNGHLTAGLRGFINELFEDSDLIDLEGLVWNEEGDEGGDEEGQQSHESDEFEVIDEGFAPPPVGAVTERVSTTSPGQDIILLSKRTCKQLMGAKTKVTEPTEKLTLIKTQSTQVVVVAGVRNLTSSQPLPEGALLAITMPSQTIPKCVIRKLNYGASEVDKRHKGEIRNLYKVKRTFAIQRRNEISLALKRLEPDFKQAQCLPHNDFEAIKKQAVFHVLQAFQHIFISLQTARDKVKAAKEVKDLQMTADEASSATTKGKNPKKKQDPRICEDFVAEQEKIRRMVFRKTVRQYQKGLRRTIQDCKDKGTSPVAISEEDEQSLTKELLRALNFALKGETLTSDDQSADSRDDEEVILKMNSEFLLRVLNTKWCYRGIFLARHYGLWMKNSIEPYLTKDLRRDGWDFIIMNKDLIRIIIDLIKKRLPFFAELQRMLHYYLQQRYHKYGVPTRQTFSQKTLEESRKAKNSRRRKCRQRKSREDEALRKKALQDSKIQKAPRKKLQAAKAAPKEEEKKITCRGLPIGRFFGNLVYNRQCQTFPHKDSGDLLGGWCVVVPFGGYTGGNLRLIEAGTEFEFEEGQVSIFRSSLLTHSNAQFHGFRNSIVLFTDRYLYNWLRDHLNVPGLEKDYARFEELMIRQFDTTAE
ncbi:hypothetical protein HDU96_002336 [Phlyctochytrium bullatum]|nr:hypothetical protein HDU96_002336 [Phlyctochytrium bullatum]